MRWGRPTTFLIDRADNDSFSNDSPLITFAAYQCNNSRIPANHVHEPEPLATGHDAAGNMDPVTLAAGLCCRSVAPFLHEEACGSAGAQGWGCRPHLHE